MTVSIPLDAATENRLRERAEQAGVEVAEFIRRLVTDAARDDAAVRFDAVLDEVFASDERPLPSTAASYSRAEIYSDGD